MWLSGRASPCQGEGRGFESRHPLGRGLCVGLRLTRWSGREARQRPAKPCTRVQIPSPPHSFPVVPTASRLLSSRAISSAGERFPDTEEVTGSIPVSRTHTPLAGVVPPSRMPARLAQRESASLTRKRSLVQSQYRAPAHSTKAAPVSPVAAFVVQSRCPLVGGALSAPPGGPPRSPAPRTGTSRRRRRPAGRRPAGRWRGPPEGCECLPACAGGELVLSSARTRCCPQLSLPASLLAIPTALRHGRGGRGTSGDEPPCPPLVPNLRSRAAGGVMRGDRPGGIPREEERQPGVLPQVEPGRPPAGGDSGSSPRRYP